MSIFIVVNNPEDWPLHIYGAEVIAAKTYLSDPRFSDLRGLKIFNLSRSYRYQSLGYYVSLLAEARGHKPLPSVNTIQDMKSQTMTRFVSDDLFELIQRTLAPIKSEEYELSIYFGRNFAKRYARLSLTLFNLFPAPLLRARFIHNRNWQLQSIGPIAGNDIPDDHKPFLLQTASEHFAGKGLRRRTQQVMRYDLAILHNPAEAQPPSDAKALKKFIKAAQQLDFDVEMITKNDYGRIAEFDALFIRETTGVNHHTYRFARRATAEGLVVIDDPASILKCTNKVYLAELMSHHKIPTPNTSIVNRGNMQAVAGTIAMPCILKQPDSAFSQGVIKVRDKAEFIAEATRMLEKSELIIAQEFMPTAFDWRIGVFNREPLYACKYYMAHGHWQIIDHNNAGKPREGRTEAIPIEQVPRNIVSIALKAANLIGDGLYGVDVKEVDSKVFVIEINDNPNIDSGLEDGIIQLDLYSRIMRGMLARIEERKGERKPR
ncbi:MAG: RimK family protein [Gammaproteobacteria bacterium]|nr:RimK family protein [Gammaproteobacteria bacterium]